jgi:hypothetical protein
MGAFLKLESRIQELESRISDLKSAFRFEILEFQIPDSSYKLSPSSWSSMSDTRPRMDSRSLRSAAISASPASESAIRPRADSSSPREERVFFGGPGLVRFQPGNHRDQHFYFLFQTIDGFEIDRARCCNTDMGDLHWVAWVA